MCSLWLPRLECRETRDIQGQKALAGWDGSFNTTRLTLSTATWHGVVGTDRSVTSMTCALFGPPCNIVWGEVVEKDIDALFIY